MEYKPKTTNMQISRMGSPSVEEDNGTGHALSDFLLQLENYNSSIPDSVVAHYLNMSGFESQDPRLIRLIALASQKFLSDIANDALLHCKMRTSSQITQTAKNQKGPKEKKHVMTMEDLVPVLQEMPKKLHVKQIYDTYMPGTASTSTKAKFL